MDKKTILESLIKKVSQLQTATNELDHDIQSLHEAISNNEIVTDEVNNNITAELSALGAIKTSCVEDFKMLNNKSFPNTFTQLHSDIENVRLSMDKSKYYEVKDYLLTLRMDDSTAQESFESIKNDLKSIDIDALSIDECEHALSNYFVLKDAFTAKTEMEKTVCIINVGRLFPVEVVQAALYNKFSTKASTDSDDSTVAPTQETIVDSIELKESDITTDTDTADSNDNNCDEGEKGDNEIITSEVDSVDITEEEQLQSDDVIDNTEDQEAEILADFGKSTADIYALLATEQGDTEKVNTYLSEQASKPFGSKKFLNSLPRDRVLQNYLKVILDSMTHYTGVTCENNVILDNMTIDDVNTSTEFLFKKGYAKACELQGLPQVYLPSEKGRSLFNSTKLKGWGEIYNPDYASTSLIDEVENNSNLYKLLVLHNWITAFTHESQSVNSSSIGPGGFIHYLKDEKALYISLAPCDVDDARECLLTLVNLYIKEDPIEELHIVAFTVDQAKVIAGILSMLDAKLFTGAIPKYVLHSYYDKSSEEFDMPTSKEMEETDEKTDEPVEDEGSSVKENNDSNPCSNDMLQNDDNSEDVISEDSDSSVISTIEDSDIVDSLEQTDISKTEESSSVQRKAVQYIANEKLYCATALCAASNDSTDVSTYYNRLAYAVNDPLMHCLYDSQKILELFGDSLNTEETYYQVSAALRNYFSNDQPYDYQIQVLQDIIKENPVCKDIAKVQDVAFELSEFKKQRHCGIDKYADYRSNDRIRFENDLANLKKTAEENFNKYIKATKVPIKSKNHKRFEKTYWLIFDANDYLAKFLESVKNDNVGDIDYAVEWLSDGFIKKGQKVTSQNINAEYIEKYMDENWKKAGEMMDFMMHSSTLLDPLRSQLSQAIKANIEIVCDWIKLHQEFEPEHDDGYEFYEGNKQRIQNTVDEALRSVRKRIEKEKEKNTKAGLRILLGTLSEISKKLKGSYSLSEYKYFYIDFLKSNYVILDDNYMPDLSCDILTLDNMRLAERIRKHANGSKVVSFVDNLNNYCDDNYGSSKLLIDYLTEKNGEEPAISKTIDEAEHQAAMDFNTNVFPEFVNNLELRQSYGQLDENDDYKEQVLGLVNRWRDWAVNTHNYGYVEALLESVTAEIEQISALRGERTVKQLDSMISSNSDFAKEHEDYINNIREVIDDQNYLVAEDMMNHFYNGDVDDDQSYPREDYLADFLIKYDGLYKQIGTSGQNLSSFISQNAIKRLKNSQDQKAAKVLKDNWPGQGVTVTQEKLKAILNCLGFDVLGNISSTQGKINYFTVRIAKPIVEDVDSYGHPIHAFGSKAVLDGFKVIWLTGLNNVDDIMAKCNELGKTKNTLIFADCKLQIDQRRALARKMKKAGYPVTFGLIDRVLYMYLVCNYSRAHIKQMLMETMMPYAYFQPYVYDSASVMPPEMFIGRKDELQTIENPSGANIVFGGRQLGKSALLRKAKLDVDKNEDNDRAVLIDIKGLDYQETANKVAQTLFDEKIIKEELSVPVDWSGISRSVKLSLNSANKEIHYLLLMLDEADKFIESCEAVNYSPFDQLKDIQQNVEPGRFKFVVAGLRNVVRFKNDIAIGNNSVLPHLDYITVKPFTTAEAKKLMEDPLYYLGFRFNDEKAHLVPMILATANYFPGLIQMYCAKLIEALKNQYAGYDESKTPPYDVNEQLIQKVLAEADFQEQIKEKFMITLRMGDDDYYYILALIMAYLNKTADKGEGYSAEDILQVAQDFNTKRLNKMSLDQINALLLELCDLNVLRKTVDAANDSKYLFSRYNFYAMMGNQSEIEDQLTDYMDEN